MKIGSKKNYIVLVLLLLVCISIGYAVLNTTLNITGKSSITKNTWDVHFENVKITDGSVEAVKVPTIENNIKVDFEAQLNLPGDFYEFTVDVANNGTIDAMIENIEKTPELTEDQKKYLNYIIEYQNGEQITSKQLVKSEEFVRVKVRVELRNDITSEDLPEVGDILNLGFTLNYVQADDTGSSVKNNGEVVRPLAYGDINEIGTIVTIGKEQFYTIGTEGDNVKLFSARSISLDENPIQDSGNETSNFADYYREDAAYSAYKGSIVEGHVNNYKNNLERKYDVNIVEARLITIDELTSDEIGCSLENYCYNAPSWTYSTSYWTGSASDDKSVWLVLLQGFLYGGGHSFSAVVRPVIVLPKNDIVVPYFNTKLNANGDINEIGTIVTIGTEKFYTIGTEGSYVKLLSMYNLNVGNEVTSYDVATDDYTLNAISNPNGMQSPNAKGALLDNSDNAILPFIGTTAFSNVNSLYQGSIVEGYVNNYKKKLEKLGVPIAEARLITLNELTNEKIGCVTDETGCTNAPSWIYSTSYWTGSYSDEENVVIVFSFGIMNSIYYSVDFGFGVRPVIVISKSFF